MRILFFVLVVFAANAFAQTPFVNQSFEAATNAARAQQYQQAINEYQTVLLRAENEQLSDEFLARIHFNLGVCFYQSKNPDKAAAEFTEAIKLSRRTNQKAFYALGMAQKDLMNFEKAEIAFREALKLKKYDGEAWFDLALVLLEEKDFDQAETAFQKAIEYKSRAASDAINNLGVIYALKHDFAAAENKFEEALYESNGKSGEAKNNLQFCRQLKRKFNRELVAQLEFSRQ